MKKFLATLLVGLSLLFASPAEAEIQTYTAEGTATGTEDETKENIIKRATTYALKNAQEQAGIYIRSFAQSQGFDPSDDEISMIVAGIVKLVDNNVEQSLVDGDKLQVRVKVTIQIDTDDLEFDKLDNSKTAVAEPIKTYKSEAKATIGNAENQDQTVERATDYALKDIRRQLDIDIRTFARARKIQLTNSEVDSIAKKVMKITDKTIDSSLVEYTIQFHVKVTVQVDPADLEREVAELARRKQAE